MNPRIYTYKITFEEVPYYYYGSKKEGVFNEEYWGSPKTNKWCWDFYTPNKQILEFFEYSEKGYRECREVEARLIKNFLSDPSCLNASSGGTFKVLPFTDERKKKISLSLIGRKPSEELRLKWSLTRKGKGNGMYGRKHKEETKRKISEKAKGRQVSVETREKISEALKGSNHPLFGTSRPENTKNKISESKIGRYLGKDNPNSRPRDWNHPIHGEYRLITVTEMVKIFPDLRANKLYCLVSGSLKSYKGWKFKGPGQQVT